MKRLSRRFTLAALMLLRSTCCITSTGLSLSRTSDKARSDGSITSQATDPRILQFGVTYGF